MLLEALKEDGVYLILDGQGEFIIDGVSYQGRVLGRVKLNDNGKNKFIFIAEGLEALATLFSISSTDEIETEGRGKMLYQQFQQDYLKDISGFYPTMEAWLLKNECAKTIDEYDSQNSR